MGKKHVQLVRIEPTDGPTDREHFESIQRERAVLHVEQSKALERLITEGDTRLHEHVHQQYKQVEAALASGEKLELARINAVQRELTQALDSAKEAVTKAENADHERFASHNNLLEKMDKQARESQQTLDKLTASFLTVAAFDAVLAGWEEWRRTVEKRFDRRQGNDEGVGARSSVLGLRFDRLVAVCAVIVALAIGIAAAVVTSNSSSSSTPTTTITTTTTP